MSLHASQQLTDFQKANLYDFLKDQDTVFKILRKEHRFEQIQMSPHVACALRTAHCVINVIKYM